MNGEKKKCSKVKHKQVIEYNNNNSTLSSMEQMIFFSLVCLFHTQTHFTSVIILKFWSIIFVCDAFVFDNDRNNRKNKHGTKWENFPLTYTTDMIIMMIIMTTKKNKSHVAHATFIHFMFVESEKRSFIKENKIKTFWPIIIINIL